MNRISSARVPAFLLLLALCVALPATAQSANGSFSFQFDNDAKTVEFNVRKAGNGAKGSMTFTGVTEFSDQDVDGSGDSGPSGSVTVTLKVDFDCFRVSTNGKRAAASGLVTQSSIAGLVGRRGLLTVEDNGEGVNQPEPDRFTWGLYRQKTTGWVASDAELVSDPGVGLTWLADDSERVPGDPDNPTLSSVEPDPGDCRAFSLSSYAVEDLIHGNGNIQVKP